MIRKPERLAEMGWAMSSNHFSEPMNHSRKVLVMATEIRMNRKCLTRFFKYFFAGPGSFVQGNPFSVVSLDQILHLSEYHLQKDGLGACPTAPEPAEGYCKKNDEQDEGEHEQGQNQGVLRPENGTEKDEFPAGNIQQDEWVSVDSYERYSYEEQEDKPAEDSSSPVPFTLWLFCIDPLPAPAVVEVDPACPGMTALLYSHASPCGALAFGGLLPFRLNT